jgi:hypothetical protein
VPTASRQNFADATITAVRANANFNDFTDIANGQASQTIVVDATTNATDANPQNMGTGTSVGTIAMGVQGGLTDANAWSTMEVDNDGDVGQYVSMASDGSRLYIAYLDFDDSSLKFATLTWNGAGAPSNIQAVRVDRYLSTGLWTNVEMVTNASLMAASSSQPMISYYSNADNGTKRSIRFAIPAFDATGTILEGTTTDPDYPEYTGNWDIITVPAISAPNGGSEKFQKTQLGVYSSATLPVVGWVGTMPEYAKLMPNN